MEKPEVNGHSEWSATKPRRDGSPFEPELRDLEDRARNGILSSVGRSEGVIIDAAQRQEYHLRRAMGLLSSLGNLPMVETIVDGEPTKIPFFTTPAVKGIGVGIDGKLRLYHHPEGDSSRFVISEEEMAHAATIIYTPHLLKGINTYNEAQLNGKDSENK